MKTYRNEFKTIFTVLLAIIAVLWLVDLLLIPISAPVMFILTLIISLFPPMGSIWDELRIDGKIISRYARCVARAAVIDYETAFVRSFLCCGRLCKVFSSIDLNGKDRRAVRQAVREKKAVIFPVTLQMQKDFPDLFAREQAVRPPVSPDQ